MDNGGIPLTDQERCCLVKKPTAKQVIVTKSQYRPTVEKDVISGYV